MKCTEYVLTPHHENESLCHCPVCGSFLPKDFPTHEKFKCKKCGTELMTLPDGENLYGEWGRICPVGDMNV